jgi:hypothetical protein
MILFRHSSIIFVKIFEFYLENQPLYYSCNILAQYVQFN